MPKKAANNEGTVRKRPDGRWEARFRDRAGNRYSVYAKTRNAAVTAMRAKLHDIDCGVFIQPDKSTLGAWLDRWFELYCKPNCRESSASSSLSAIQNHIIPALGAIPLQNIRADQLQAFVNELADTGLAPSTVHRICVPLKQALKRAYLTKMIPTNPADFLQMPHGQQKQITALDADQQKVLLQALPQTTAGDALRFALVTGLRASELCGLHWGDIVNDVLSVQRSAQYVRVDSGHYELRIYPPKTTAGKRDIPLSAFHLSLLTRQHQRQYVERMAAGSAWNAGKPGEGDTPIFATALGTHADRDNLGRVLRKTLKGAGLPAIGLHALRHSFASTLTITGNDMRTVSELLGHSDPGFTLRAYAHSNMTVKTAAVTAALSAVGVE